MQGEESFSDYLKVVVRENPIVISGIDSSAGWVQISNPSATRVDVSSWMLLAGDDLLFRFPEGTLIAERAKAVFATTSFASAPVALRYPNDVVALIQSFDAPMPASATQGVVVVPSINHVAQKTEATKIKEDTVVLNESAPELPQPTEVNQPMIASLGQADISPTQMLLLSIGGGIFAGSLVFVSHRYWQRTTTV